MGSKPEASNYFSQIPEPKSDEDDDAARIGEAVKHVPIVRKTKCVSVDPKCVRMNAAKKPFWIARYS